MTELVPETPPVEDQKPEPKTYDEDYVKRTREEAKQWREKAQTAERERDELAKFKTERERADLEAEKKYKELADAEKKRADETEKTASERVKSYERSFIIAKAEALAIKAGILDPDDVEKGLALDDLKVDGKQVVGLEQAVEKLKEAKPHWFKSEKPAESIEDKPKKDRSGAPPASSNKDPEDSDVRLWTPEQFQRMRDKIRGVSRI